MVTIGSGEVRPVEAVHQPASARVSPRRIYHAALLHAGMHGAVISVLERVDKPELHRTVRDHADRVNGE